MFAITVRIIIDHCCDNCWAAHEHCRTVDPFVKLLQIVDKQKSKTPLEWFHIRLLHNNFFQSAQMYTLSLFRQKWFRTQPHHTE